MRNRVLIGTSTAPMRMTASAGMDPLGPVQHPKRDLVAGCDAQSNKAAGNGVDVPGKLGERPAAVLEDEGLARAVAREALIHERADRPLRETSRRPNATSTPSVGARPLRCAAMPE